MQAETPNACCAAARGTTKRPTAALLIATGTNPATGTGTGTTVFGWGCFRYEGVAINRANRVVSRVGDKTHGRRLHQCRSKSRVARRSHTAGWTNAGISPCVMVIRSHWQVSAEAMAQGAYFKVQNLKFMCCQSASDVT